MTTFPRSAGGPSAANCSANATSDATLRSEAAAFDDVAARWDAAWSGAQRTAAAPLAGERPLAILPR